MAAPPDDSRIFLSYSRTDSDWAQRMRVRLGEAGLASFLDRYGLPAGQPWQPFLEAELARASAVVVLCGRAGLGNWQQREIAIALDRQASAPAPLPVIPVLLPGNEEPPVGTFLSLNTWVDLREAPDDPEAWDRLFAGVRGAAPDGGAGRVLSDAICPYRGLMAFREQDAGLFFGREQEVETLVRRVTGRTAHNLVGVIGRSGSGKSSVVFAGLLPALRRARARDGEPVWDVLDLTPGAEPLQALVRAFDPPATELGALAALDHINGGSALLREGRVGLDQLVRNRLARAEERGTDRLLLIVDQWEELYTLAQPAEAAGTGAARPGDVQRFIDLLLNAGRNAPVTVVLTARADFYDRLIEHSGLKAALDDGLVPIGPMSREGLVAAIEKPARAVGFSLQPQLVRLLLGDLGVAGPSTDPAAATGPLYDAGRLPLLEFALERTWRSARAAKRTELLAQDYIDIGGLEGALEATANEQFARLSPAAQAAARRLMVSLVSPGEGRGDARARAIVRGDAATAEALRAFTSRDARLISTDADPCQNGSAFAEVTHEALIRHWGLLREWVAANRVTLRRRDQIREALTRWRENGEQDSYLLPRGIQLEVGRALLADHGDVLIDELVPFIERSIVADAAVQRAERQRMRRWMLVLGAAALVASLSALAAGTFYVNAREQAHEASQQRWRALAALAQEFRRSGDAGTALALALRAVPSGRERRTDDVALVDRAANALWSSLADLRERRVLTAHEGGAHAVAYAPDGQFLVSAGADAAVRVWRVVEAGTALEPVVTLRGHTAAVHAVAVSPDGQHVASAGVDRRIRLWRIDGGAPPVELAGHEGTVNDLAFSPDGQVLASAGADGTVRAWRLGPTPEGMVLTRHVGEAWSVGFSPDGARVVSAGDDAVLQVTASDGVTPPLHLAGHDGRVAAADFHPTRAVMLASGGWDGVLRIWELDGSGDGDTLRGHDGWINMVGFTPDGTRIVSAGQDGSVRLWRLDGGKDPLVLRGHLGDVWAAVASPDGRMIASAGADGTVRLWRTSEEPEEPRVFRDARSPVQAVAFGPDGWVATADAMGRIRVRALDGTGTAELLGTHGDGAAVQAIAYAADGRLLASAGADGLLRLWQLGGGAPGAREASVLSGHRGIVHGVAIDPNGGFLASAGADATVRVWPLGAGGPRVLEGHRGAVQAVAVSSDGRQVASGGDDGTVRIWDPLGTAPARMLPHAFAPPVRALAFSPDGNRLVVAGAEGELRIVPTDGSHATVELKGHLGWLNSVTFGTLGRRVATAGQDGTVRIWRPDGTGEPWVLRGHEGFVLSVAVSPNGRLLASGGRDGTLRVWRFERDPEELIRRGCEALPRVLTREQRAGFGLDLQGAWPCPAEAQRLWPNIAPAEGVVARR